MLDTLLTFLNENQLIAAFLTVSGLASPVFGGIAALFRKKSNLNLAALNAIDDDNKDLTKKLITAESQLKLYDPNLIVARLNQLKAEGAPEAELQKAAEKYFFFQNKAITVAAKHLAECALHHEHADGNAALYEAQRWLSLGLSASPRNPDLVTQLEQINTRLNAEELDIPEEMLEIDPSLNLAQIDKITTDLIAKAQYPLAEVYAKRGIILARQEFGETHENYGTALHNLARLLRAAGHFEEAEPLFRQSLENARKALGEDHPKFGTRLNNFSGLLKDTGRFEEAEPLYRQSLENAREALGEDHPIYGTRLNNLAGLLKDTGRFEEAEPLFRQAAENARVALGEEHPDYGTSLDSLAGLLRATGRFEEAEPLFRKALKITSAALGEVHPTFGIHLNNLALLLHLTGRFEEAELLYRQALENTRAALGGDHPTVGSYLTNLGGLLEATGRFEEAEPLYRQAVEVTHKALGPEHPNTKTLKANFELFLTEQSSRN